MNATPELLHGKITWLTTKNKRPENRHMKVLEGGCRQHAHRQSLCEVCYSKVRCEDTQPRNQKSRRKTNLANKVSVSSTGPKAYYRIETHWHLTRTQRRLQQLHKPAASNKEAESWLPQLKREDMWKTARQSTSAPDNGNQRGNLVELAQKRTEFRSQGRKLVDFGAYNSHKLCSNEPSKQPCTRSIPEASDSKPRE